jgi:WD40 repeat protein
VWDEESGVLHRKLEGSSVEIHIAASFLSPDGQQARLVAGSNDGQLHVYDPEAGSLLHRLEGHTNMINDLACIASSSAAPHHPRMVSASYDGTVKVWDGETGEMLADWGGYYEACWLVAVWKEHTGGHDRIATATYGGEVKIWDGEAFTLLHDFDVGSAIERIIPFESAEGPTRLLVVTDTRKAGRGIQVWDPEEGRLLHDGINRGWPLNDCHPFKSARGRHLLAIRGRGYEHPCHPGDTMRAFLDLWDLGEAPAPANPVRGAHKHG